jgi:hypothetical protein
MEFAMKLEIVNAMTDSLESIAIPARTITMIIPSANIVLQVIPAMHMAAAIPMETVFVKLDIQELSVMNALPITSAIQIVHSFHCPVHWTLTTSM